MRRFGTNEHRKRLLAGLEKALVSLAKAGCRSVWLNGSFVSTKDRPEDYDGIWEYHGIRVDLLDPVFLDDTNNFKAMRDKFKGELYPERGTYLHDFFRTDRGGTPKGVVRLDPRELL